MTKRRQDKIESNVAFRSDMLRQIGFSPSSIRKNKDAISKGAIILPHVCPQLRWNEEALDWNLFSPDCSCMEHYIERLGVAAYIIRRQTWGKLPFMCSPRRLV
jgi:hypothetical protein